MYKLLIRPILFLFDPEKVHNFTFKSLNILGKLPGVRSLWRSMYKVNNQRLKREFFGITFENPVGLAAGFDKDAKLIDELACMGFGFIEIGTLTPKGQPGNPKPRLFRLPLDQAVINRMGFNNQGVEEAIKKLKKRSSKIIIGGNIGKNKVTPNDEAKRDYALCFEALFPYVDYFTINVSSPNTPNLRALQDKEPLIDLIKHVQERNASKKNPKPVLLKIAPDLTESQLEDIIDITNEVHLDGIIATNTTIERSNLVTLESKVDAIGAGGLSGLPVKDKSNQVIRFLRSRLGKEYPIIGVGGIMNEKDALEKFSAGASLIQIYTGFIYEGPALVKQINKALLSNGI